MNGENDTVATQVDAESVALDEEALAEVCRLARGVVGNLNGRYISSGYASLDSDFDANADRFVRNGKVEVTIYLKSGPGEVAVDSGALHITLAPGSRLRFVGPTSEVKI